ncbi:hypothetical protein JHU04_002832 [Brenneria sp. 4F2]|nr:hypothetical protein [Brenneria bubanii]
MPLFFITGLSLGYNMGYTLWQPASGQQSRRVILHRTAYPGGVKADQLPVDAFANCNHPRACFVIGKIE